MTAFKRSGVTTAVAPLLLIFTPFSHFVFCPLKIVILLFFQMICHSGSDIISIIFFEVIIPMKINVKRIMSLLRCIRC